MISGFLNGTKQFEIVEGGSLVGFSGIAMSGLSKEEPALNVSKFSDETIETLRKALGYGDVVVKCIACGQYGAVKTSCKHCGHPIDPE